MITETVWSPIKDTNKSNINNSPIWRQCFHTDEMTEEVWKISDTWYKYTVKFDGLKPIHLTNMKIIKKGRDGSFR